MPALHLRAATMTSANQEPADELPGLLDVLAHALRSCDIIGSGPSLWPVRNLRT